MATATPRSELFCTPSNNDDSLDLGADGEQDYSFQPGGDQGAFNDAPRAPGRRSPSGRNR
jgi:hypothetical protein